MQEQHGIKSLANILVKHLTELGKYWAKYLPFVMYVYNPLCSLNLNGFSPYELVFGRKPKHFLI